MKRLVDYQNSQEQISRAKRVVGGVFGILWKGLFASIDFVLFIDHALTPTFSPSPF